MLIYGNEAFRITVDAPPGLYKMSNVSATGKTYMKNLLLTMRRGGANVLCLDAEHREVKGVPELVVVDRFDAFPVDEEVLTALAQEAVVLVDSKRLLLFGKVARGATVTLDKGGISVCAL